MPNTVHFGKGTATSEQDLLLKFDTFIQGIVGWERIDVVADSASDREYVYKSSGEVPGRYHDIYARYRAVDNTLYNAMYTLWKTSTVDSDGEIYNSNYTRMPVVTSSIYWWAFGNMDGIWIVVKDSGSYFSSYCGYMQSYYPDDVDYRPVVCIGQMYNYRWFDEARALTYHPWEDTITTLSGNNCTMSSNKDLYNYCLAYHDPSDRDGSVGHVPVVVYYAGTGSVAQLAHVRGELLHCVQLAGNGLSSEDWVSISGTNYKYFVQYYANDETMGFGPVDTASGTDWSV